MKLINNRIPILMKIQEYTMKTILIGFLMALCLTGFTQETQDRPENEENSFENYIRKHRTNPIRTRWILLDLGLSGMHTDELYTLGNGVDIFETRLWNSSNVNLHIVQQKFSLVNGYLNLKYGLSIDHHKYYFDNPVIWLEDAPQVEIVYDDPAQYKKYRISYSYLTVPFMLDFSSRPLRSYKSFHLAAGVYGGVLLGANYKLKKKGDKTKYKDNFNLNKFRIGLRGEIGYGPVIFYLNWSFTDLFEEKKNGGYVITPFSVGIQVLPF